MGRGEEGLGGVVRGEEGGGGVERWFGGVRGVGRRGAWDLLPITHHLPPNHYPPPPTISI